MVNDEEDHALVADEKALTEFALMANTNAKNKDLSWTGLPEFADDTVTDYSRPSPTMESTSGKTVTPKKPSVKYAEQYRKPNKKPNVRGNQRNWNNLKSHQLGPNFVMQKRHALTVGSSQKNINDKGYWDSGCSRHMTCNISYLSDYEPFDGGYVRDFKLVDDANIFLRTPRQHNMYSIDLNNIVPYKDLTCLVAKASADEWKFKAKGDGGYFIRYSMSSKEFRVQILLKDVANQKVKKNASSLRYIALPNWVHDALLESSSSKPQDDCSTDGPESSRNPNLTASTTYPPTDQLETLTVESPIPTASLPVPTACFNDSPESSSDARLISKRVANQVETPSLDNILTLSNRFENILGVTTNSDESNGVEVDEEGIDYDEVFAPIARIEAIRLFLAYASFMGFTVFQMDVKSAFLCGTIDEEVEFEALMHEKFQMSAMGELNFFLGLQVLQKDDGIFLSQDKYVGDILKKFRYSDVRSSNTPMDKDSPWGKDGTGKDVDLHLYRSMIGSLMYLTTSRPDIMFAVCAYARHQVTPKECHLHAVKRIFRYLKGHLKLGLWYPKESPFDLVA
nr:hypothetical protein [Tanacetum cinerariifolium]